MKLVDDFTSVYGLGYSQTLQGTHILCNVDKDIVITKHNDALTPQTGSALKVHFSTPQRKTFKRLFQQLWGFTSDLWKGQQTPHRRAAARYEA